MRKEKSKKIFGKSERPRISVFRSNKGIYAQIINDETGRTLVSSSSREKIFHHSKKTKMELSSEVGKLLGGRAVKLKIKKLVFDRGRYLYHGRVKSLAEGIRKSGLKF
ncbi:50S ribosomal protein L18 [Blattabacterium cuenoti]|uniref:50S ribosomal protein L18 n=1 Tax=Blattabacterium cuenoti TaxID=1653831 RepID=UPI00163BFB97|nr:50S ribosomal protein L18 [Blattabacterium cuenoti]